MFGAAEDIVVLVLIMGTCRPSIHSFPTAIVVRPSPVSVLDDDPCESYPSVLTSSAPS